MNTESGRTEYVIPDVLISRENNKWKITLNDSWMGEYTYNDYYIRMMQTATDPELKEYFRTRLERARLIVTSIERRRTTIIQIVEAILEYQSDFFLKGGDLVSMTMDSVARQLNISTSTVYPTPVSGLTCKVLNPGSGRPLNRPCRPAFIFLFCSIFTQMRL